jgi:hypothetical protein
MRAVVRPDTPVVVGFSLGVFAVLVIQEGNDFLQHRLGHRKARAEHRPGELEGEVRADAFVGNEILEAGSRTSIWIVVKLDPFVDSFVDRISDSGFEMRLS